MYPLVALLLIIFKQYRRQFYDISPHRRTFIPRETREPSIDPVNEGAIVAPGGNFPRNLRSFNDPEFFIAFRRRGRLLSGGGGIFEESEKADIAIASGRKIIYRGTWRLRHGDGGARRYYSRREDSGTATEIPPIARSASYITRDRGRSDDRRTERTTTAAATAAAAAVYRSY